MFILMVEVVKQNVVVRVIKIVGNEPLIPILLVHFQQFLHGVIAPPKSKRVTAGISRSCVNVHIGSAAIHQPECAGKDADEVIRIT